jgi:hypothetical protein
MYSKVEEMTDNQDKAINIENLQEWLSFWKFFLGTFVLGMVSFLINSSIQNREIEIKEQEHIAKYIEHAIEDDIGIRLRFAQYFGYVTRSETLRERWKEYLKVVQAEYDRNQLEKDRLIAELKQKQKQKTITALEKDILIAKIDEYELALNPKPSKSMASLPSIIYLHIPNTAQRQKAREISNILSGAGFSVPDIDVLTLAPNTTTLKYFRMREKDHALSVVNLIKNKVKVKLQYVKGYESSNKLRDRHFELWFSENAFEPL